MTDWTGYLHVIGEKKGEKSILQDSYYRGAFKITRPVYLDDSGQACLYVMNPGGGYVEGDSYRMEIQLEPGAEVLLTTQSSTKIYKTIEHPILQSMEVILKEGSRLEYLPDPVIAFQHARFKQDMVVHMERNATLICTDILTPGWAPDGSMFRYDLLQSRMKVFQEGKLVFFDHLKLEPDEQIQQLGSMEKYTHLGTMVIIHEGIDEEVVDELYQLASFASESRIGISLLMIPGITIRVQAHRTQDIEEWFGRCHEWIRERLLGSGKVFLRKY
ncbi:urease accessory protein UreD [Ammoniphilus sp. 3BR4]|uniref:urease accessory protein UreD n=1 Tax=Ammoniphilus sp. 3BR4 TaxID=3158265 RepID=UPI003465BD03